MVGGARWHAHEESARSLDYHQGDPVGMGELDERPTSEPGVVINTFDSNVGDLERGSVHRRPAGLTALRFSGGRHRDVTAGVFAALRGRRGGPFYDSAPGARPLQALVR